MRVRFSPASCWSGSRLLPHNAALAAALFVFAATSTYAIDPLENAFERVYPIDPDGELTIHNTDGNIRIYAADVAEIHVYATMKAYTPARLNGIGIEVKSSPKLLSIETHFPPPPSHWSFADRSGTVEYTLIVPPKLNIAACELSTGEILIEGLQEGRAKAHLANGWLAAHNSFADLDVAIDNGRLDVAYDWWQPEKKFVATARSIDGGIHAVIPPDASLTISAQTDAGKIANNYDADDAEHRSFSSSVELSIGSGAGVQMKLRSQTGNIRIDRSY